MMLILLFIWSDKMIDGYGIGKEGWDGIVPSKSKGWDL